MNFRRHHTPGASGCFQPVIQVRESNIRPRLPASWLVGAVLLASLL